MTTQERREMLDKFCDKFNVSIESRSTYGTYDTTELIYKGLVVGKIAGYEPNRAGFACLSAYDFIMDNSDEWFLDMLIEAESEIKSIDKRLFEKLNLIDKILSILPIDADKTLREILISRGFVIKENGQILKDGKQIWWEIGNSQLDSKNWTSNYYIIDFLGREISKFAS